MKIIKYFSLPNIENFSCENLFNELYKEKMNSFSKSKMRCTLFEKNEFNYKNIEDPKKTYFNVFQDELVEKVKDIHRFYTYYNEWSTENQFQDLGENPDLFSQEILEKIKDTRKAMYKKEIKVEWIR